MSEDQHLTNTANATDTWRAALYWRDQSILAAHQAGHTMYRIAERTGLSQSGIRRIINRHQETQP